MHSLCKIGNKKNQRRLNSSAGTPFYLSQDVSGNSLTPGYILVFPATLFSLISRGGRERHTADLPL